MFLSLFCFFLFWIISFWLTLMTCLSINLFGFLINLGMDSESLGVWSSWYSFFFLWFSLFGFFLKKILMRPALSFFHLFCLVNILSSFNNITGLVMVVQVSQPSQDVLISMPYQLILHVKKLISKNNLILEKKIENYFK